MATVCMIKAMNDGMLDGYNKLSAGSIEGSKLGTVEPAEDGREEGTVDSFTLNDGSLDVGIGDGLEVVLLVGLFVEAEVGPGVATFVGLGVASVLQIQAARA